MAPGDGADGDAVVTAQINAHRASFYRLGHEIGGEVRDGRDWFEKLGLNGGFTIGADQFSDFDIALVLDLETKFVEDFTQMFLANGPRTLGHAQSLGAEVGGDAEERDVVFIFHTMRFWK